MESNTTLFYHFLRTKLEEEEEENLQKKTNMNTSNTGLIKSESVWINPQTPKVLLPLLDPWEIKKVLTGSDVGSNCRLLLKKQIVHNFVYPNCDPTLVYDIEYGQERKEVTARDLDEGSDHKLIFSNLKSRSSYILNGDWSSGFVKRRGLKTNDLIGLYWNTRLSFFAFTVLARAKPTSSSSSSSSSSSLDR